MKLRKGDEVPRPRPWRVVVHNLNAARGWSELLAQAPGNLDRAWTDITSDPRSVANPARQHRLKYDLGSVKVGGAVLDQWQYEITGGGRIWYAIDDENRTLYLTLAGTGHPRQTDRRR
ncbi:hypothetical protein APR12_002604 [Nocardia amikacinitolerans]|uniref:hypothetical protein n=1 Tax=Nocardia amikacinitolerans TaxID=756689 RepID=UPI000830868C|nr:hypothetical protein [Nocardia amikacinitolerans]MCP2317258.1 hypothetical protein [Nocardia amikacinitolerans]